MKAEEDTTLRRRLPARAGRLLTRLDALSDRYERQYLWLKRRLTRGQYLGLHLTLGLLAAVGCLWIFYVLAESVVTTDAIVYVDAVVANLLNEIATPAATNVFLVVTALGSIETLALLGVVFTVLYAVRGRRFHAAVWVAALGGAVVLNELLKWLFARPRPVLDHPLLSEGGYSFPSGHAMDSLVVYGMLAYFAVLALRALGYRRRAQVLAVAGVALLIALIGFSRLYLGVHYVSDVLGGFAAGGVWLSACITGLGIARRKRAEKFRVDSEGG